MTDQPTVAYLPERHKSLHDENLVWNEEAARVAIRNILTHSITKYLDLGYWPAHPLDDEKSEKKSFDDIYMGDSGNIWGLKQLSEKYDLSFDASSSIKKSLDKMIAGYNEESTTRSSYLFGELGTRLAKFKISEDNIDYLEIKKIINEEKVENSYNELCLGTPGMLLAALDLYQFSGNDEDAQLCHEIKDIVVQNFVETEKYPHKHWTQTFKKHDLETKFFGFIHGFVGNVYALYKFSQVFPEGILIEQYKKELEKQLELRKVEKDDLLNWSPWMDEHRKYCLLHLCHGAPGVLLGALKIFEDKNVNDRTLELLERGAGLIWEAGTLNKGANICHGTGGNGMALLRMYEFTGDEKWLERARKMAMKCIEQVQDHFQEYGDYRYSLWTGDIGTAYFLDACINKVSMLPFMED